MDSGRVLLPKGQVARFYGDNEQRQTLLAENPGFHNLVGFETTWRENPELMNFLAPSSPLFLTKKLSTEIYMRFLNSYLATAPPWSSVLDAGCGIGRFTIELSRRFSKVKAFDPCKSSIEVCRKLNLPNVELHWADLSWTDALPAQSFDIIFAMELICYTSDWEESLIKLIRLAKPGAWIFVSVEGRPGALTAQSLPDPKSLLKALKGDPLFIPNERFVVFHTQNQLEALFRNHGLTQIYSEGSHFFGEGPFWNSIDEGLLEKQDYRDRIWEAEARFRSDPILSPWARVFLTAGKVA